MAMTDNTNLKFVVKTHYSDDATHEAHVTFDPIVYDETSPILKLARDALKDVLADQVAQGKFDEASLNNSLARALHDRLKFQGHIDDNTTFAVQVDAINPGATVGIKIKF